LSRPSTTQAGRTPRRKIVGAINFIRPYPSLRSKIRSLSIRRFAPHLGRMKQPGNKTGTEAGKSASRTARMRPLDPELLKFVETLAIADAKRDHFALSSPRRSEFPTQRVPGQDHREMTRAVMQDFRPSFRTKKRLTTRLLCVGPMPTGKRSMSARLTRTRRALVRPSLVVTVACNSWTRSDSAIRCRHR